MLDSKNHTSKKKSIKIFKKPFWYSSKQEYTNHLISLPSWCDIGGDMAMALIIYYDSGF